MEQKDFVLDIETLGKKPGAYILEIGAFTGYSAICLASGLPENGHLDSLEINDGEIIAHTTTFYGICKNCLDKKNLQKSS